MRNHTYSDDRYNAFRGILAELEERWSYPCLRGLPGRELITALSWQHVLGATVERISSHPSWSWCGWSGPIKIPQQDLRRAVGDVEASEGDILYRWRWDKYEQVVFSRTIVPTNATPSASSSSIETMSISTVGGDTLVADSLEPMSTTSMVHQTIVDPLVLCFIASSALVDLKLVRIGKEVVYGIAFPGTSQLCGRIALPNDKKPRPETLLAECLLFARSNPCSFQPDHKHLPTSSIHCKPRKKLSALLWPTNRLSTPDLPTQLPLDTTAHVLLVEYREDGICERIGVGDMNEGCFRAWHPIMREVKLG